MHFFPVVQHVLLLLELEDGSIRLKSSEHYY